MLRQPEHKQRGREADVRRGERLQRAFRLRRQRLGVTGSRVPSRSSSVPLTGDHAPAHGRTGVESTRWT
jgi:hypothetical protein